MLSVVVFLRRWSKEKQVLKSDDKEAPPENYCEEGVYATMDKETPGRFLLRNRTRAWFCNPKIQSAG